MWEVKLDNGTLEYVHPALDDDTDRAGYRFRCGACGWLSPVMKWREGGERHADEHECAES